MILSSFNKIVLANFLGLSVLGLIAFRMFTFSQFPQVLNRDELALAYNAWTITTNGVDEWGESFPLVFRSFGDYKLPGYIYSLSGLFLMFGDHDFLIRVPSLLASVGIAMVTFLIGYRLTTSIVSGAVLSVVVATSQWALHYGNVGFEANLSLLFFIIAVIGYWKSRQDTKWFLLGSIAYFVSAMTYNTPMLLIPPLLIVMMFLRRVSVFQVVITGLLWVTIIASQSTAIMGKTGISIFSDQGLRLQQQELRQKNTTILGRVQYHPVSFYAQTIATNMVSHFSPEFLVSTGGENPWHQPPGFGHVQWPFLIFAIIGVGYAIQKKNPFLLFLCFALPISLVPAGITVDAPHATRSLFFFFLISLFAGIGIVQMISHKKLSIVATVLLMFGLLSTTTYMKEYSVSYQSKIQTEWRDDLWHELAVIEPTLLDQNDPYCISGDPQYDYIVVLWKDRVPVNTFLTTRQLGEKNSLGFRPVERLGDQYEFKINCLDYIDQTL